MEAILSIETGKGGFREVGTEGRSVVKDATRVKLVRHAAAMQRRWQGRAVRIQEFDRTIYADTPSREWTYHCACDLARACEFHSSGESEA